MSPSLVSDDAHDDSVPQATHEEPKVASQSLLREPLKPTGAIECFEHFDVTPCIGREFRNVNLAEWLEAPNANDLLKDLAITSKFKCCGMSCHQLKRRSNHELHSRNEELSSSASKMMSTTHSRNS